MKIMTKEFMKSIEFHNLITALQPNSNKKIPFVFTNGGTDCVAEKDLHTVKTNFNVTEKENQINFVMIPDMFDEEDGYDEDGYGVYAKTYKDCFLLTYLNRLRVISYLPDEILKKVKDKRLLALGYAEEETKKEILSYIINKYNEAITVLIECGKACNEVEKELTFYEQIQDYPYIESLVFLLNDEDIKEAKKVNDELYLTLYRLTLVFSGAEIIEEEVKVENSTVKQIELYKVNGRYELHLLISKTDENLIENFYYATYAFNDLKIKK